jgi:hypothetical protein
LKRRGYERVEIPGGRWITERMKRMKKIDRDRIRIRGMERIERMIVISREA